MHQFAKNVVDPVRNCERSICLIQHDRSQIASQLDYTNKREHALFKAVLDNFSKHGNIVFAQKMFFTLMCTLWPTCLASGAFILITRKLKIIHLV